MQYARPGRRPDSSAQTLSGKHASAVPVQNPVDRRNELFGSPTSLSTEQVGWLDRSERPAPAQLTVRNLTLIKAHRYEPGIIRRMLAQLVDGQQQLLVLIALAHACTLPGKAREENQGIVSNSASYVRFPVLARPKINGIPPYQDSSRLKRTLQPVSMMRISTRIGKEGVPRGTVRIVHDSQVYGQTSHPPPARLHSELPDTRTSSRRAQRI